MRSKLNVGVIGLGRLGRIYASELAQRVPNACLVAVADKSHVAASSFAAQYGVPRWYPGHEELLADGDIEAVVVVTPTRTHSEVVMAAAACGKAIFCEKPIVLSLGEARRMLDAVASAGVFFQAGFQRRFDAGYLAAREKVAAGAIGTPMLLRSTSRDPFPPPVEFCDPSSSGGLIVDMGIHDFHVARLFMGEVKTVLPRGRRWPARSWPESETSTMRSST
ncbi:MAG: Gfo/Idh/MocA family oxidoreductase [Bryobacteraceae bacterium]